MTEWEKKSPPDWSALLDELKGKEELLSDAKLAESLGVTRGYLCSVRKGRKNISLELAETILSRLGRPNDITQMSQLFVPVKVRKRTQYLVPKTQNVVQQHVKAIARGHCQLCGKPAPFNGPDGSPYLEVHLLVSLEEGGSDTVENCVALCPNCHRKLHICPTSEDKQRLEQLGKIPTYR